MAPLSSPDSSQSRFGGGSCSASMAPLLPASGFGFDGRPHLQRLLQSSAARSEDSSFQIQGQFGQCYLPQKPEPTSRHSCTEMPRSGNCSVEIAATDPARDPTQLGQAFPSYGHGGPAILPSLTRYHSAPSSVLADLTGMANGVIIPNSELGRFLSGSNIVADVKAELKPLDASRNRRLNLIENQVSMAAPSMDRLGSLDNGFAAAHGHYQKPGSDGELLSQMSMDADDVPLIPSPDTLSEVGNTALHSPSSFNQKSRFIFENNTSENGVHGAPPVTDGLLRHSSSPAGILSQLTDDYERHMVASSSANSSEEGSYERQGDQGLFNGHAWDDNGHMTSSHLDGMPVARKRIRDLLGSSYLGSTLLDSQKADALESTMLGSFFGMPMTDSPEIMYLTDKVSSDSIPCRTRAKRGCATHPRSIAERVRRTKISERMKKLQELVPHMDKQANTAEMLDEVVDYVKCLQRQVKELTENQPKCNCACGKPRDTTTASSK